MPEQSVTVQKIYEWHEKQEEKRKGPHQGRLGASVIGRPCDRSLWYSFRGLVDKKFEGRMLRLFETGHLEEPRLVKELRGIGCTVHEVDSNTGKQFEFTALGGHFVCHPDAAILGLPEAPKTWHIGEFKTMGGTEDQKSKDFEKVKADGVKRAKPEHYAQMQIGMGLSGMTRAIYIAKKKATDELYSERVKYDCADFQNLISRAEQIIKSNAPLERCSNRPDDYRCKFCDAFSLCWATGGTETPEVKYAVHIKRKTCQSCCHFTYELNGENAQWSCSYNKEQKGACDGHLLLPGLVSFAEATDGNTEENWIEFTSHDTGVVWKHGNGEGMWTTEELLRTPIGLVGDKAVQQIKDNFDGTVVAFDNDERLTLLERYPAGDSELVWEGSPKDGDAIGQVIAGALGSGPLEVTAEEKEDENSGCLEYNGKLLLIYSKVLDKMQILKGKE